jgi:hypothetical protein
MHRVSPAGIRLQVKQGRQSGHCETAIRDLISDGSLSDKLTMKGLAPWNSFVRNVRLRQQANALTETGWLNRSVWFSQPVSECVNCPVRLNL